MLTTFMKWMASAALLAGLALPAFPGRYTVGYHVGWLILISAAAFFCFYYGSLFGQRIVVRQTQPEGTVSFHHA